MAVAKILVVDDEPVLRELLALDFQNKGFETFEAGNPNEALHQLKSTRVDAVTSDIRMPGGGGLKLLQDIKARPSAPYVVFITGLADLTVEAAMDEGAEGYFKKPIDRKALTQKIESLLKPLEERWIQKVTLPPNTRNVRINNLKRNDASLQVGRGGFSFVSNETNFKSEEIIQFSVSFAKGILSGVGQVQWTREVRDSSQLVVGIEFLELSSSSVSYLLAQLVDNPTAAYIPKGSPSTP